MRAHSGSEEELMSVTRTTRELLVSIIVGTFHHHRPAGAKQVVCMRGTRCVFEVLNRDMNASDKKTTTQDHSWTSRLQKVVRGWQDIKFQSVPLFWDVFVCSAQRLQRTVYVWPTQHNGMKRSVSAARTHIIHISFSPWPTCSQTWPIFVFLSLPFVLFCPFWQFP